MLFSNFITIRLVLFKVISVYLNKVVTIYLVVKNIFIIYFKSIGTKLITLKNIKKAKEVKYKFNFLLILNKYNLTNFKLFLSLSNFIRVK